jgi:hypothetical protein
VRASNSQARLKVFEPTDTVRKLYGVARPKPRQAPFVGYPSFGRGFLFVNARFREGIFWAAREQGRLSGHCPRPY